MYWNLLQNLHFVFFENPNDTQYKYFMPAYKDLTSS